MSWNKGKSWSGEDWGRPYPTWNPSWEHGHDWGASSNPSWGHTVPVAPPFPPPGVPWRGNPPPVAPHVSPPMQATQVGHETQAERKTRRQREDAEYRQWLQAELKRLDDGAKARQKRRQLKEAIEADVKQENVDEEENKGGESEANVASSTGEHGDSVAADASSSQSKPVNEFGEEASRVGKTEEDEQGKHDRDNDHGTTAESRPESSEDVNAGDLPPSALS